MAINLQGYWNRFDRANGYKRHLYRQARGLQSAEMNEIHDYVHDNFWQFTDALVGDGVVMQGGEINVKADASEAICQEGAFIAEGYILTLLARSDIPISPVGTYNIGAIVKQEVITELEDPSLRDPATGTRNFNEPGAGAMKITARWGLDSEAPNPAVERFYPVHKIVDGQVVSGKTSDQPEQVADPVKELVARYDRDANGNFIVDGLGVQFDVDDAGAEEHIMLVNAGLGHVYGYEQLFSNRTKVRLRWGTDEKFVNNEPVNFTGDGWYPLRETPIAQMIEVFGITREQDEGVTKGATQFDELSLQPVVDIEAISSLPAGAGTVYVEGVDWVQSGNNVEWLLTGSSPSVGTTYYATYTWNQEITPSVLINPEKTEVYIEGLISGTVCYCDYNYYIPRYDKIVLTRDGLFKVVEGNANERDLIKVPNVASGLPLADILIEYGKAPLVLPGGTRAYRMTDIEYIMKVLQDMRYNMARMAQVTDAGLRDPSTDKRNMFVDGFDDLDLIDLGLDNNCAIADGHLQGKISWTPKLLKTGKLVRLPYTELLPPELRNTAYSKTRKINELDIVVNTQTINITPKSFQWISDFDGSGVSPELENDPGAEIPTAPAQGGPVTISVTGKTFSSSEKVGVFIDGDQVLNQGTQTASPPGYASGAHYWPATVQGEVSFSFTIPSGVKACKDMNDSIEIKVMGMTSSVYAVDGFYATARLGKTAFNVVQGRINSLQRTVNDNVRRIGSLERGVAELDRSLNDLDGRVVTLERTPRIIQQITNVTRISAVRQIVVNNRWWGGGNGGGGDPLAQTFIPNQTCFATSCDIFITQKPANVDPKKNYVLIAIHGTQVGIPDRVQTLTVSVKVSGELTNNTWNKFTFQEPFKLEAGTEYALVFFTPDTETYMRVAEIGQYNLEPGNSGWMSTQPHSGVLLQSANRRTWTPLQKEDATFRLNVADFDASVNTLLGSTVVTNATDLNLTFGVEELPGAVAAFYAILPDRLNERHDLPLGKTVKIKEYSGQVDVYADLETTDSFISPTLDGEITLSVGVIDLPGTYTSRAFEIDAGEDLMKIWLDRYEPANTSITVQLMTSGDGTLPGHWTNAILNSEKPIGDGWMDSEYRVDLTGFPLLDETRVRLVMNTTDLNKYNRPQAENLRAYIAIPR